MAMVGDGVTRRGVSVPEARHVTGWPARAHPLLAQPWVNLGTSGTGPRGVIPSAAKHLLRPAPPQQYPAAQGNDGTLRPCGIPLPIFRVPAMPSFDIVSEVDTHELINAVDQANRELSTRFDFKGVEARFEREDAVITQSAPSEFQLQQMTDILRARLVARKIDARCLEFGDIDTNVAGARQKVTV